MKLLVAEGMAEPILLLAAQKRRSRRHDVARKAAVQTAAALYVGRAGEITLAELVQELIRLQHFPSQGGKKWAPSSVKGLLNKGRSLRLIQDIPPSKPASPKSIRHIVGFARRNHPNM